MEGTVRSFLSRDACDTPGRKPVALRRRDHSVFQATRFPIARKTNLVHVLNNLHNLFSHVLLTHSLTRTENPRFAAPVKRYEGMGHLARLQVRGFVLITVTFTSFSGTHGV